MDLSQKRWRYLTRRLLFPSPLCPQHLTGGDGGAVYIRSWCIVAGAPGNFSMKGSLAEFVAADNLEVCAKWNEQKVSELAWVESKTRRSEPKFQGNCRSCLFWRNGV